MPRLWRTQQVREDVLDHADIDPLANNITGGAKPTITITTAANVSDTHIILSEWNGDLEVDQTNTNDSSATTNHHGGDITTAHAATIVALASRMQTTYAVSSRSESYAQINSTNRLGTQYQIYSSTTTTDADWTSAVNGSAGNCIASFNVIVDAAAARRIIIIQWK